MTANQWGVKGSNGGDAVVLLTNQNIEGDFLVDSDSKLHINLVKSLTLPTGIIDNVDLTLYDKDIEEGDILVMCSDGILDSNVEYKNKELWVKY